MFSLPVTSASWIPPQTGALQTASSASVTSAVLTQPSGSSQVEPLGDALTLQEQPQKASGNWLNTHAYSSKVDWPTLAALNAQQGAALTGSDKLLLALASTQTPHAISSKKGQALQLFQVNATQQSSELTGLNTPQSLPQAALLAFDPNRSWIVKALLRGKQTHLEECTVLAYPAAETGNKQALTHLLQGSIKALTAQGKSNLYAVLPKAQQATFAALHFEPLKAKLTPKEASLAEGKALENLLLNHFESDTHQVMQLQLPKTAPIVAPTPLPVAALG
jgi:hypothetical protein